MIALQFDITNHPGIPLKQLRIPPVQETLVSMDTAPGVLSLGPPRGGLNEVVLYPPPAHERRGGSYLGSN